MRNSYLAVRLGLLCFVACGVVTPLITADDRYDEISTAGVLGITFSFHDGEHRSPDVCSGEDRCLATIHRTETNENTENWITESGSVLKYPLRVEYVTPFAGRMYAESEQWSGGYQSWASAEKAWKERYIDGSDGELKIWLKRDSSPYPDDLRAYAIMTSAHIKFEGSDSQPELDHPDPEDPPTTPPHIEAYLREGGIPVVTDGCIEFDEDGAPVWDVAPDVYLTYESSVTFQVGTGVTYTYKLQNLSSQARLFNLPQVKTTQFPTGWSGTVQANSTVQTSRLDATWSSVWTQTCQVDVGLVGGAHHAARPVRMYVPQSARAFVGTCAISSVVEQGSPRRSVVTFTVSGQTASGAVLYREEPSGHLKLIESAQQTLSPGTSYQLIDTTAFPSGVNTYRVRVGYQVNGYTSESESVSN